MINLLAALLIDQVQSCHSATAQFTGSHARSMTSLNRRGCANRRYENFRDNYRHGMKRWKLTKVGKFFNRKKADKGDSILIANKRYRLTY